MLALFDEVPRWLKIVVAVGVLAFCSFLAYRGTIWIWGFAFGGFLLLLGLIGPIGPPRKQR